MTNVAILGFGVVGSGVADLITNNAEELKKLTSQTINIKYILDLRDFPNSPFAARVVHDYNIILSDPEVKTVIEVMGGSHPAYEYTVSALKAGKNVVTSNKEVVANFGDEFLKLAKENSVSYRFEAAVGGGIPVISPMINCISQNKICEVRGILNGTTNYILTKMFSFGDSFENALRDAQEKGYAERNPDADILGIDAARKIVILTALVTGKLIPADAIHTEGITKIRKADVLAAELIGAKIKLVGRCVCCGDIPYVFVAPFLVSSENALANVQGVYNAVEVIGEPIGNVMFYGKGAGAGATASAVVGDLVQATLLSDCAIAPVFEKCDDAHSFADFTSRSYIAVKDISRADITKVFGQVSFIDTDEVSFITTEISEGEAEEKLSEIEKLGASVLSRIRLI